MHANQCMHEKKLFIHRIGGAWQTARELTGTTQEALDEINSRTYTNATERFITPLNKVDEIAGVMGLSHEGSCDGLCQHLRHRA
ncbi:hypothetical protein [Comamonas testosteroni]|uniref:hypothetical protein n=1 Tax=Comamonas testosteroni TaxID=285 RepID=UPI00391D0D03